MLLIDKEKDFNYIVVNVRDNESYGDYIITLYSDFTKREFAFNLYEDLSPHPTRYNKFKISTLQFDKIIDGTYRYYITQDDVVQDKGMMRVFSLSESNIYTEASSPDDDFVVYED